MYWLSKDTFHHHCFVSPIIKIQVFEFNSYYYHIIKHQLSLLTNGKTNGIAQERAHCPVVFCCAFFVRVELRHRVRTLQWYQQINSNEIRKCFTLIRAISISWIKQSRRRLWPTSMRFIYINQSKPKQIPALILWCIVYRWFSAIQLNC